MEEIDEQSYVLKRMKEGRRWELLCTSWMGAPRIATNDGEGWLSVSDWDSWNSSQKRKKRQRAIMKDKDGT